MHLAQCLVYSRQWIIYACVYVSLPTLYHHILLILPLHFHADIFFNFKVLPSFSFAWQTIAESSTNSTSLWNLLWSFKQGDESLLRVPDVILWQWLACQVTLSFESLFHFEVDKTQCGVQQTGASWELSGEWINDAVVKRRRLGPPPVLSGKEDLA